MPVGSCAGSWKTSWGGRRDPCRPAGPRCLTCCSCKPPCPCLASSWLPCPHQMRPPGLCVSWAPWPAGSPGLRGVGLGAICCACCEQHAHSPGDKSQHALPHMTHASGTPSSAIHSTWRWVQGLPSPARVTIHELQAHAPQPHDQHCCALRGVQRAEPRACLIAVQMC
jgi:hypothetical protein